jgi:wobble nucleotide-excising tRNase
MKIARIKEIKNIGPFSQLVNGARFGFEKLTFIYALNTYGKTTLSDIFRSFKENDNSLIVDRKTIPGNGGEQKVNFSFNKNDGEPETDILFQGGRWNPNEISKNIEIFNSEFISKNVINGSAINRENKENFTQFIVGEQGFLLSEWIAKEKKSLADKKRDLKNKIPDFVKEHSDSEINKYINFSVEGLEIEGINEEIANKTILLKKEEERLKEPTKILNLPEPQKIVFEKSKIIDKIKQFNSLLDKNYADIKEDALEKFNERLKNNFLGSEDAENWIKQGLSYCSDGKKDKCPFCGQNILEANQVIELYDSYFAPAYIEFAEEISSSLSAIILFLKKESFGKKTVLQEALIKIDKFKELIIEDDFFVKVLGLEAIIGGIGEEGLSESVKEVVNIAENKSQEKERSPYKKIDNIIITDLEKEFNEYFTDIEQGISIIEDCVRAIILFKDKYKDTALILTNVEKLKKELRLLECKAARIKEDKDCENYKLAIKEVSELDVKVKADELKLRSGQSVFIDKYFLEINELFKKFGSKNFTLEKEEDKHGYKPVYSLKVKFKGREIPDNNIRAVFSESDKRSLALAIFWAKINLKTDSEKNETIIILDDPVTSFDDNRVTNSIRLFKDAMTSIGQLIIFTHYPNFIKRFNELRGENSTKMLEIKQNNDTSYFDELDEKIVVASDYDKLFFKIHGFINNEHSDCIKADLRPFFENYYIPSVFALQIRKNNICGKLSDVIDCLCVCGAINEEDKNKLHDFRNTLNPDSHILTSNNVEDVRNFASEMMEFLFSLKFIYEK